MSTHSLASKLKLVVVGKDQDSIDNFNLTHVLPYDPVLIANTAGQPLSRIGNAFLTYCTQVLGLVHADTYFGPGSLDAFITCALDRNVCGIVGRESDHMEYRDSWCSKNPGPVVTLDACSVFFHRDLGLEFDSYTFDSYHCHVEDLCMQAQSKGIPVVVPAADATHLASGHDPNGPWIKEYARYRNALAVKWEKRGLVVMTT